MDLPTVFKRKLCIKFLYQKIIVDSVIRRDRNCIVNFTLWTLLEVAKVIVHIAIINFNIDGVKQIAIAIILYVNSNRARVILCNYSMCKVYLVIYSISYIHIKEGEKMKVFVSVYLFDSSIILYNICMYIHKYTVRNADAAFHHLWRVYLSWMSFGFLCYRLGSSILSNKNVTNHLLIIINYLE